MAPTPSPRPLPPTHHTPSKTPQSKHRLHFSNHKTGPHPPPTPASATRETGIPTEHPVEVIARIRDYPDGKEKPLSALEITTEGRLVRVRTDIGYRDFSLDGASVAEDEHLDGFYKRFVEARIAGVRQGAKCTIMMYGPTGSGKSHTMFGCAKQPGIVYRALKDILGEAGEGESGVDNAGFGLGLFVQVAVLEIYNEEIYDLLSGNLSAGGVGIGLQKGNTPKVRLEVMGKKAKNATYISGNEAGKISREVAKVEKRRIVKSTLCNERSSRSHCLIIMDVPSVGGRLMLVDMAGSENIEQAGQTGFEAKMQTAKINQGNIALKRVVESIANGDSHVPFRDSKLTMLLQDSFEDDKSKILMILCASPDLKEIHKTISTLEYGAKAKCIVRAAHMSTPKDKLDPDESSVLLRSRIVAMNQFIFKLQMDNKVKQKECHEANKELLRKEEELAVLKAKLKLIEGTGSAAKEEEINSKVDERTQTLRIELMRMEEKMLQQQAELNALRRRLEEMESERDKFGEDALQDIDGGRLMKRLSEIYAEGDQGMEKSMDLDMGDQQMIPDIREIKEEQTQSQSYSNCSLLSTHLSDIEGNRKLPDKIYLSTVFEGEDEGEEMESMEGDEVYKEVVEENVGDGSRKDAYLTYLVQTPMFHTRYADDADCYVDSVENHAAVEHHIVENAKDSASARRTRIQNIFRLCGNHRELAQQVSVRTPSKKQPDAAQTHSSPLALGKELGPKDGMESLTHTELRTHHNTESPISALLAPFASLQLTDEMKSAELQSFKRSISSKTSDKLKENSKPGEAGAEGLMEVYVKWEASKESSGSLSKKLKVLKNSTLSDLRKLIEIHLEEENNGQQFTFLLLGDPSGAPVTKEKEATVEASKLPICNNQPNVRLACLRPAKKGVQRPDHHIPFASLENTLTSPISQHAQGFSPKLSPSNISYLTGLRA